ncbi:MAG: DUF2852 domain-containing protein [Pseudomonadota bacterium]
MNRLSQWLRDAEAMLDSKGKGAWIAAMVIAFVLAWPLGLALLGYMIWSGRMGCWKKHRKSNRNGFGRKTGNAAFDSYRDATLRRLEDEQTAFETFLERLRAAKDKAEFDQFMDDRRAGEAGGPAPQAG